MISAIVAVDNNWGIGYNDNLLEHIPDDLKYFKQLTSNKMVVMGRKTWDSLPIKPLPDRLNIVITHIDNINKEENVIFCNLETAKLLVNDTCNSVSDAEIFIIGGGLIYKEFFDMYDRIYVTKIFKDHDNVDTFFSNLDKMEEWSPTMCSSIYQYNDLSYQFWQYDRI